MDKIPVIIDRDPQLQYETIGTTRKIINFVWVPFLNSLSEDIGDKLIKTSKDAAEVKKYKTTHKALDTMYDFDGRINLENGFWNGVFTYIWLHLNNPKALRNRLKLVKKLLKKTFVEHWDTKKINILSLGAGSSRAVLETIKAIEGEGTQRPLIEAKFVDINQEALNQSCALAEKLHLNCQIIYEREKAENLDKICADFKPDIVEMVGLLDYFNNERALRLLTGIYKHLNNGGTLVSCNIKNNPERKFITNVVKWYMVYRDEKDIANLITKAGFEPHKAEIILEPLEIHCLFMAKK